MATMPVIDALDQCKIALQYIAERQSDRLTAVLEILLEQLYCAWDKMKLLRTSGKS